MTKAEAGKVVLYEVTVNWFGTTTDPKCSISTAAGVSPGLTATGTELVSLSPKQGETGVFKDFGDVTVDCGTKSTEITGLTLEAGALFEYTKIKLVANGTAPKTIQFLADGNVTASSLNSLPFAFNGADLLVSGSGAGGVLVELKYATTAGNTCDAKN